MARLRRPSALGIVDGDRADHAHEPRRLEVELRTEDRKVYARPWTAPVRAELVADTEMIETDTEMIEYVCNENQKDVWRKDKQELILPVAKRKAVIGAGTWGRADPTPCSATDSGMTRDTALSLSR